MDASALTTIGLSPQQAAAYALLIEHGSIKPAEAAGQLETTRTNSYKLFDKLAAMGLAVKADEGKTITYALANPVALTNLTARYRAEATAREEAANHLMHQLLAKYHLHASRPGVESFTGRQAVAAAYRQQINLHEDIWFIRTHADIPTMGFETMHDIRSAPAHHGNKRCAIMSRSDDQAPINHAAHRRSNLDITWLEADDYRAPVEWSVTDSSLLIVLYAAEPHAILIFDPLVAGAFQQIWQLLHKLLTPLEPNRSLGAV